MRTIKRDYARINPMPSAAIVMRQLPLGSITTTGFIPTKRWDTVHRESLSQTVQPRRACPPLRGNNTTQLHKSYPASVAISAFRKAARNRTH